MTIAQFVISDAYVNLESSTLNVMVLLTFSRACATDCQELQVQKLNHITSNTSKTLVIIYNGDAHMQNVLFIGRTRHS